MTFTGWTGEGAKGRDEGMDWERMKGTDGYKRLVIEAAYGTPACAAWPVESTSEGPRERWSAPGLSRDWATVQVVEWSDGAQVIGACAVVQVSGRRHAWSRVFASVADAEEWSSAVAYEWVQGPLVASLAR